MGRPVHSPRSLGTRMAGQSAIVLSGFVLSQGFSFVRNAIIGHWLSKGDFGVAASLTLVLQLIETLSDLGPERLVVQHRHGAKARFMATAQSAVLIRGVVTALLLYLLAGPAARFFAIPEAEAAFEALALVPLLKGFLHLDSRRQQRRLVNMPSVAVEVVPQAAALAATIPALILAGGFEAVVWISAVQAIAMVLTAFVLRSRPFRLALDPAVLSTIVTFGWPVWLSALPLVLVYQGDRALIGHFAGMEALALYSAAFMITMVPGLVAAKAGHALMLPLFADCRGRPRIRAARVTAMSELTAYAASLYLAVAVIAGGNVTELAFGPQYTGLDTVVAVLAVMWALRMLQALPGMVLMADGITRPFLVAGLIRASALVPAGILAAQGAGLAAISASGVLGEALSLAYVAWRMSRTQQGLASAFLVRASLLLPATLLALGLSALVPGNAGPMAAFAAAILAAGLVTGLAAGFMPLLRAFLRGHFEAARSPYSETAGTASGKAR